MMNPMEISTSFLVMGVLIVSPLLFVVFTSLEFYFKKVSRARTEYNKARGTIHKNLIKKGLIKLKLEIQKTKNELDSAIQAEKRLHSERDTELEKAATVFVFETGFTGIPGIGKVLKERVRRTCFNGTLQSLGGAWRVNGIGDNKAYEIRKWIETTRRRLPSILKGDFPNKQRINNKYNDLLKKAEDRISGIESDFEPMVELEKTCNLELDGLNKVTSSTFQSSYNGDETSRDAVTNYHLGCFPEWRRVPGWFKALLEVYS